MRAEECGTGGGAEGAAAQVTACCCWCCCWWPLVRTFRRRSVYPGEPASTSIHSHGVYVNRHSLQLSVQRNTSGYGSRARTHSPEVPQPY